MGLEPADLAQWAWFAAKGGTGKCVAQCECMAESLDDLIILMVCSCLDLDTCFASSLVQDGEIIALLQIPNLENFFLIYIPVDVASRTFFYSHRS